MENTSGLAKENKSSDYPEPLIIFSAQEHRHTLIILHGRGSSAQKFSTNLLETKIPGIGSLVDAFPSAKFVFPTASKRRATAHNRSLIDQWFDYWSLETPAKREEIQIEGLSETAAYMHGLLKAEIALIGAKNVVLWGLSQGCAAILVSLLTWSGEPLAAAVGMCGWLPFRERLEEIVRDLKFSEDDEDPFSRSDEENTAGVMSTHSPITYEEPNPCNRGEILPLKALTYLTDELELPAPRPQQSMPFQQTPIFIGHGIEDEKVPVDLGREAARCLRDTMATAVVHWKQYEGLGHWYSEEMLRDIVSFVREKAGWTVPENAEQ